MSKPFISVVMPVYGVEQYLNRAAESILQQTFQDIELNAVPFARKLQTKTIALR